MGDIDMIDFIVLGIVLILAAAASYYIYKQKKKGVKCIGCPSAGTCGKKSCGGCSCSKDSTSFKE